MIPFINTGTYPTRGGNQLRPLIDGEPAFRRICEAIEAAESRVWVTITFLWDSFRMPDGRGTVWDVLDRAVSRGIDVRLICWRPDDETDWLRKNAFWGSEAQIALLETRRSGVKIRWGRAQRGFCQHQKSWLIDAGCDRAVAFVGGINLNPHSMVSPGHHGEEGQNHDVYFEVQGPSVTDVQHNFVQRWNESSEWTDSNGRWGAGSEIDLPFPDGVAPECGPVEIQVQRTGRDERSIFEQYVMAINAAQRTIYIENQQIDVPEIIDCLHGALDRGIAVILLSPTVTHRTIFQRLWEFDHFLLAGIASVVNRQQRKPVYVHAKVMLIDDRWGTAGSCNLHRFSLFGNSELNVAFADGETAKAFRSALFLEHLGVDTSGMDDLAAFRLFRSVARENRRKFDDDVHDWQGLAYEQTVSL